MFDTAEAEEPAGVECRVAHRAAAAVCDAAEAQQAGGGSVPRAHHEQRLSVLTPPRLRSRRVLSAACSSGAAAAVCDAAEAQQAGGCLSAACSS